MHGISLMGCVGVYGLQLEKTNLRATMRLHCKTLSKTQENNGRSSHVNGTGTWSTILSSLSQEKTITIVLPEKNEVK